MHLAHRYILFGPIKKIVELVAKSCNGQISHKMCISVSLQKSEDPAALGWSMCALGMLLISPPPTPRPTQHAPADLSV